MQDVNLNKSYTEGYGAFKCMFSDYVLFIVSHESTLSNTSTIK